MAVYNYCLLLELSGGLRSVSILCLHASLSYNCILTVVKYTDMLCYKTVGLRWPAGKPKTGLGKDPLVKNVDWMPSNKSLL